MRRVRVPLPLSCFLLFRLSRAIRRQGVAVLCLQASSHRRFRRRALTGSTSCLAEAAGVMTSARWKSHQDRRTGTGTATVEQWEWQDGTRREIVQVK
jgi:hypothetical protein